MVDFHYWYRASITQAFLAGIISFTQPGIWTALSNLGAGGLSSVTTAYIATSVSYGLMVVLSAPTAYLMNRFGIRFVVFVGCFGYIFYSAGLYLNSKTGAQWLIILGGFLCGVSSAPLWQAEALIALNYPEKHRRGLFIGIWQALNKLGSIIAGIIVTILNVNSDKSGKVSLNTYVVLIAIQATGPFLAYLVAPPEKVIRTDGTKVHDNRTNDTFMQSLKKFWNILTRKEILILAPLMLTNSWYKTWQGNYMVHNFSVRARSLNVLLSSACSAIGDLVGAWALDYPGVSNKVKARVSWVVFAALFSGYFIWAFISQGHIQANGITDIDWHGSSFFAASYVPFVIFKIPCELVFNWIWWVVGLYGYRPSEMSYVIAVIRGLESLGGVLSYVVGVVNKNDTTNLAISAGAFWIVLPFATYVAWTVPDAVAPEDIEDEEFGKVQIASDDSEAGIPEEKVKDSSVSLVKKVSDDSE
ncbi:putative notoamide biosynthesis cluster protein O' [[Candida] jaroonii]|uniref:Notoamide biosynthesis cluster protein O n=1 Tax=[Candida] jaroonii TaxID=467808 RepID=A0ACA9Y2T3_9ASCO|nr:putative notoamide biosynthesis cluster protein O' [[Candida] jaroonii]